MKIVNIIYAFIFVYFTVVQYNDPDPELWMLVYGFAALSTILALLGRVRKYFLIIGIITFSVLALTLVPGVIDWFQAGNPTEIFGEMDRSKLYIEQTREFFGLMIAISSLVLNWIYSKRK